MEPQITFFPVGNGDMTLIRLGDSAGRRILIDCKIRQSADDPKDDARDVASDLRARLPKDPNGRPYVDVFLLSHPDEDHCLGLQRHFYLGPPDDYPDDGKLDTEKRILIHEIWSSPLVFRRHCRKSHLLCDDAKAFNAEARRRVKVNRDKAFVGVKAGDRILVLGEDISGKTDDLGPILVKADSEFSRVNGEETSYLKVHFLAPQSPHDDETEEALSKNDSSVVAVFHLAVDPGVTDACHFLTGGDAGVLIWERLWEKYKSTPEVLSYDLLQTPHHCSWHSLSWDSWSELGEDAEVSISASAALSQAMDRALIVSSSNAIVDDDIDPPCIRAKREYAKTVVRVSGRFYCTGEYPSQRNLQPLEVRISRGGPVIETLSAAAAAVSTPQRAG